MSEEMYLVEENGRKTTDMMDFRPNVWLRAKSGYQIFIQKRSFFVFFKTLLQTA